MIITLQIFQEKHMQDTFYWMQDENLKRDFLFDFLVTQKSHERWFERYKQDETQKIWAIYAENFYVGNIGLKSIDLENRKAEIWIYIGEKSMHGKGIGQISFKMLWDDFAFKELNLHKIYSYVADWNVASKKMLLKAGFVQEGILSDEIKFLGHFVTLLRFGLLLDAEI